MSYYSPEVINRSHVKGQSFASFCYTNKYYFVFQQWKSTAPKSRAETLQFEAAYSLWKDSIRDTCLNRPCMQCQEDKRIRNETYMKYHADVAQMRRQRIAKRFNKRISESYTPNSFNSGETIA